MRGTRHERGWNKRIIRDRSPRVIAQRSYRGAACHLQRRSHCVFSAAEEFVGPSGVDCDPVFSGCFAMSAARETLRSEEHTSELQSLMRISYAVFCLKKTQNTKQPAHLH